MCACASSARTAERSVASMSPRFAPRPMHAMWSWPMAMIELRSPVASRRSIISATRRWQRPLCALSWSPSVRRPKDEELPLFSRVQEEKAEPRERVFRVSELNRAVRGFLESTYANVWVEGELTDVTRSAAGHIYFTLNDEGDPAQVRGVIFRNDAVRTRAKLENGARVRFRGRL